MSSASPTSRASPAARRRARRRAMAALGLAVPFGVVLLWVLVNRVEWLGPLVADSLRAVIGKAAVTEIEDIAYSIQDRINRLMRAGEAPTARWVVPPTEVSGPLVGPVTVDAGSDAAPIPQVFHLADVGPVHRSWSAPGDGCWISYPVPVVATADPALFKSLLHPDKNRAWAELFVVAINLEQSELHLVPGSREPVATETAALSLPRPGRIPDLAHDSVLAAFNGGLKTEHGGYGMALDGVTRIAPKPNVCVVA